MTSSKQLVRQDQAPASLIEGWRLSRIDIRSPVSPDAWPVARIELEHPQRGRVTDLAAAPGAFDAAFKAAAQILGISPRLISFNVVSAAPAAEGALSIHLIIELERDGQVYTGSSFGVDLARCSMCAWLEAATKLEPASRVSTKATETRPYQTSGIDENDDLWIFASTDAEAAEAIAVEFREDGYRAVDCILTGPPRT